MAFGKRCPSCELQGFFFKNENGNQECFMCGYEVTPEGKIVNEGWDMDINKTEEGEPNFFDVAHRIDGIFDND